MGSRTIEERAAEAVRARIDEQNPDSTHDRDRTIDLKESAIAWIIATAARIALDVLADSNARALGGAATAGPRCAKCGSADLWTEHRPASERRRTLGGLLRKCQRKWTDDVLPAAPPTPYDGTLCADCECYHGSRLLTIESRCICRNDGHPWRKMGAPPTADAGEQAAPLDWKTDGVYHRVVDGARQARVYRTAPNTAGDWLWSCEGRGSTIDEAKDAVRRAFGGASPTAAPGDLTPAEGRLRAACEGADGVTEVSVADLRAILASRTGKAASSTTPDPLAAAALRVTEAAQLHPSKECYLVGVEAIRALVDAIDNAAAPSVKAAPGDLLDRMAEALREAWNGRPSPFSLDTLNQWAALLSSHAALRSGEPVTPAAGGEWTPSEEQVEDMARHGCDRAGVEYCDERREDVTIVLAGRSLHWGHAIEAGRIFADAVLTRAAQLRQSRSGAADAANPVPDLGHIHNFPEDGPCACGESARPDARADAAGAGQEMPREPQKNDTAG